MIDYANARRTMVDCQVRTSAVTDARILDAMTFEPRELFVPEQMRPLAYVDMDIPVGHAVPRRHILEPTIFARLVQAAEIGASDVVLDVGCATGYSSAVIARLAGSVVALESEAALAETANRNLAEVANVAVIKGDLEKGYAKEGPYDAIILEGAVDKVPEPLLAQLKDGGRLVAIVGEGRAARAMLHVRSGSDISSRSVFEAAAPMLLPPTAAEVFAFPL